MSNKIEEVIKDDFEEIMKRISPYIPKETGIEVTTIGKWVCSKNRREITTPHPKNSYKV